MCSFEDVYILWGRFSENEVPGVATESGPFFRVYVSLFWVLFSVRKNRSDFESSLRCAGFFCSPHGITDKSITLVRMVVIP